LDFIHAACPGRGCRQTTPTKLKPTAVWYKYFCAECENGVHAAGNTVVVPSVGDLFGCCSIIELGGGLTYCNFRFKMPGCCVCLD